MGCASSKPVREGSGVLVRKPDEQAAVAPSHQSLDDAYHRAASLEIAASDDSFGKQTSSRVYGPDGFELVGQLGTRKAGTLKLMRNRRSKELLVARCLSRADHGSDEELQKIAAEAITHRKLVHPNVIAFHEFFASPTALVTIMEYAQGGRLQERIATMGRLSEAQAQPLFMQLINAVSFAHDLGICHRTLCMDNLLLTGSFTEPRLKITGLGYGVNGPQPDIRLGIPDPHKAPYMAPELLSSENSSFEALDGRALDAWACGAILFKMVTGESPFKTDEPDSRAGKVIASRVIRCDYAYPETTVLSSRVKDLISHILVKDPEERYTLSQMASHPWLDKVPTPAQDLTVPSAQSEKAILQVIASISSGQPLEGSGQLLSSLGKGDEPPPPLTPDPGAEGNTRPSRVTSYRLEIDEEVEDADLAEPYTHQAAAKDPGGSHTGTPARTPSQRISTPAVTPETPPLVTPQAPARAFRKTPPSPFADVWDEGDEPRPASAGPARSSLDPPGERATTPPDGSTDVYSPRPTGLAGYNKVVGSVSWSRPLRTQPSNAAERSLSGPNDPASPAGPRALELKVSSPREGDAARQLSSSIRSRLQARLGDRPSSQQRSGDASVFLEDGDDDDDEGSQLASPRPGEPGPEHRRGEPQRKPVSEIEEYGAPSGSEEYGTPSRRARVPQEGSTPRTPRRAQVSQEGSTPRTPENSGLLSVMEDGTAETPGTGTSGFSRSPSAAGSPPERYFGDSRQDSKTRPKFKIAAELDRSLSDTQASTARSGGEEAPPKARGVLPKAISKTRQMADAVARAVAEATGASPTLSPANSGHHAKQQRVGNLKDSPQWAFLQANFGAAEELRVRRITDPPVLQTTKSLARSVDLRHHKYVPPTTSKYKWEAPKLSLSGPPSAPASPSPFIQGPRTKPWVPHAPSVVQILEDAPQTTQILADAPEDDAPGSPAPPQARRLPIFRPPESARPSKPSAPTAQAGPRRALTFSALRERALAAAESGRGRGAGRKLPSAGDGASGSRSISLDRDSGGALDRNWGSAPMGDRRRASSIDAPPRGVQPARADAEGRRDRAPTQARALQDDVQASPAQARALRQDMKGREAQESGSLEEERPAAGGRGMGPLPESPGGRVRHFKDGKGASPALLESVRSKGVARPRGDDDSEEEDEEEAEEDEFPVEQRPESLIKTQDLVSTSGGLRGDRRRRGAHMGTADLLSTSDGLTVSMHRAALAVDSRSLRAARFSRYAARTSAPVVPLDRLASGRKGKPLWAQPLRELVPRTDSLASARSLPVQQGELPSTASGRKPKANFPAMFGSPAPVWTQDAFWDAEPEAVQNVVLQYWDLWAALDTRSEWGSDLPPESLVEKAMRDSDDEEDQEHWKLHHGWSARQDLPPAAECLTTM
eukprot:jgi/Botrbrau1/6465/Bobra.0034s0040.2